MEPDIGQYEVLRGERFAHATEPILSFARREVWVNMVCLKRLPSIVYVHFLFLRDTQRLIIKPGMEESLDVVRWRTPSGKPRKILCDKDFWNEVTLFTGWTNKNRYRLLGRFVHDSNWDGFAFDMKRAEIFPLRENAPSLQQDREVVPENPLVPSQTWIEHCRNPLINRFEEDTLIEIDKEER